MSTPKRIFTLSTGSQTISLAEFRPDKKGAFELHAVETRELIPDPAADATRVAQSALALGEMVESLKAKGRSVRITLPAQSTFSRMVKLPAMSGTDLEQTVMFEAKQNIPYPLEEVVWDHRIVYESQAHEPEVLIAAAKMDLLEEWTAAVAGSGMQPSGIELAPVALYNAFRYNYGEPEGCTLLIDLGARTTNLIFIEPGKFFIRTISSGGSALTSAVAKEFSEPFAMAESRKRTDGFVGQGSNFAEPEDPEQARLAKVLRNAVTRLHAEVTRSISFYRSQQAGGAPQRILLCGNSAQTPLMLEFWEEKMGLPVEMFDPLRCVGVSRNLNQGALALSSVQLGEHVGLALQLRFECPVSVNLLPPALRNKSRVGQIALAVALSAFCLTAPMIAWGAYLRQHAEWSQKKAELLVPQIARVKKLADKIKETQREINDVLKTTKPLEQAIHERRYWLTLLDQIHAGLPKELVWVTSFDVDVVAKEGKGEETAASPKTPASPPASGAKDQTTPRTVVRYLLKGFYMENPNGAKVVDAFGNALKKQSELVSEYWAAHEGFKAAQASQLEGTKPKETGETLEKAEERLRKAEESLRSEGLTSHPVGYTVAPVEEWIKINKPNPTEWAQDFAIPLELIQPPSKTPVLTP
jgi:type IV pilus assembly protein PilM